MGLYSGITMALNILNTSLMPASGKTILTLLLAQHIQQQDPG